MGWRACVAFPKAFVTHANALLTPGGRRRLAACVVDGDWLLLWAAGRFQVPPPQPGVWAGLLRRVHAPSGERALMWVNALRVG